MFLISSKKTGSFDVNYIVIKSQKLHTYCIIFCDIDIFPFRQMEIELCPSILRDFLNEYTNLL